MADTKQMLVDSLRDRLYEEAVVNAAEQYCTPAEDGQIGAIEWIFACHQVEEGKLIQLLYLYVDLCEVPNVSQAHIAMLVAMTEIVPCKKEVTGTANVYYLGFYCFHDVESLAYLEISPDRVGESVQETIDMVTSFQSHGLNDNPDALTNAELEVLQGQVYVVDLAAEMSHYDSFKLMFANRIRLQVSSMNLKGMQTTERAVELLWWMGYTNEWAKYKEDVLEIREALAEEAALAEALAQQASEALTAEALAAEAMLGGISAT